MDTSIPLQIAETIQTAHINPAPSIDHDLAPSTSADAKLPLEKVHPASSSSSKKSPYTYPREPSSATAAAEDDNASLSSLDSSSSIPSTILRPTPRRPSLPPLPDLRFEQSYLSSISPYTSPNPVQPLMIVYITVRDQVLAPLLQGTVWTLALLGWRFWNKSARFSGRGVGARVRRWWWGVNGWVIPEEKGKGGKIGDIVKDVDLKDPKAAGRVEEFYLQ